MKNPVHPFAVLVVAIAAAVAVGCRSRGPRVESVRAPDGTGPTLLHPGEDSASECPLPYLELRSTKYAKEFVLAVSNRCDRTIFIQTEGKETVLFGIEFFVDGQWKWDGICLNDCFTWCQIPPNGAREFRLESRVALKKGRHRISVFIECDFPDETGWHRQWRANLEPDAPENNELLAIGSF